MYDEIINNEFFGLDYDNPVSKIFKKYSKKRKTDEQLTLTQKIKEAQVLGDNNLVNELRRRYAETEMEEYERKQEKKRKSQAIINNSEYESVLQQNKDEIFNDLKEKIENEGPQKMVLDEKMQDHILEKVKTLTEKRVCCNDLFQYDEPGKRGETFREAMKLASEKGAGKIFSMKEFMGSDYDRKKKVSLMNKDTVKQIKINKCAQVIKNYIKRIKKFTGANVAKDRTNPQTINKNIKRLVEIYYNDQYLDLQKIKGDAAENVETKKKLIEKQNELAQCKSNLKLCHRENKKIMQINLAPLNKKITNSAPSKLLQTSPIPIIPIPNPLSTPINKTPTKQSPIPSISQFSPNDIGGFSFKSQSPNTLNNLSLFSGSNFN
jgi:hypothetical protein